jgi:diadenosine tetraphosphatase ApaH/serine/threonine PP2A family protein phosphatase
MARMLAIGDIHGCYPKLIRLIKKIKVDPIEDILIFLGDYIDRGDQSKEVVDFLISLKQRMPQSVFLMGNHEQMLLEYLSGENENPYLINGGKKTLFSYFGTDRPGSSSEIQSMFPSEHLEFFYSLSPYWEIENFLFVHAGLRDGVPLEFQELSDLLWIREDFYFSRFDFGKTVVFGHTPFPNPFRFNRRLGIDTGAVYGNKLTCVELPAEKFYSV